ncbi:hypothetical protein SPRG_04700 [Saprolegnia parasitica CBS 223.65]|uniref:DIRP domain-containing protein n=1 Tax=Saprolegnia parasitica (strain CBS 223.65) TaxID=695850 RepID=A0A067CJ97_SAPPC|nr:hypothetical protein SPRG_04700 [Saprolegnia parasitica CBS 223.65]KDO30799.1 hypothetical protein SPRG_04700 [Saprolegnia parasitica CBS 223.65]|eukprot:XP_012198496.1 hypothetical protein SPRG_04700 [Saprolegnia parasitica CBS 223.65]
MGWTDRLGPRWTHDDVRAFFHLFRANMELMKTKPDEAIAAIASELPARTPDMVRALVAMHKGFLSLPMATDEGLYAILTDHYNAQVEWEREAAMKVTAQATKRTQPRKPLKRRSLRSSERKLFVAAIDEAFFEHSEFQDCLSQMNMAHVQRAKRTEWSAIRLSMGHPRRFSATFLNEERQKLYRYRNVVRYAQRTKEFPTDIRFPYKIYHPLAIGTQVRVLHPNKLTQRLCVGRVCSVSTMDHSYEVIVTYADHKEILNCPDTSVMLVESPQPSLLYWQQQPLKVTVAPAVHTTRDEADFCCDARGHNALAAKGMLLSALARMNDRALVLLADPSTTYAGLVHFQSQYAWVIVNLDTTNDVLAAALHRLQSVQHTPAESLLMEPHGLESSLNPQQIGWAHQFLTAAHEKSRSLVATSIQRLAKDDRAMSISSKTNDVLMGCMDLVLTLQCAANSKDDRQLAPVVLHKLLDRNLEHIMPRSQANMSLYHEICQSVEVLKSVLMHPPSS